MVGGPFFNAPVASGWTFTIVLSRLIAAVMRAEALSRKPAHIGAVVFSQTGDPATGDFGDAKIIKKFGEVPDDLSTL
jgi:hypothetical protein